MQEFKLNHDSKRGPRCICKQPDVETPASVKFHFDGATLNLYVHIYIYMCKPFDMIKRQKNHLSLSVFRKCKAKIHVWGIPFETKRINKTYRYIQQRRFAFALNVVVWHRPVLPISFKVKSLALEQSCDCPIARWYTLKLLDEYISGPNENGHYNHIKTELPKTCAYFMGGYCRSMPNHIL